MAFAYKGNTMIVVGGNNLVANLKLALDNLDKIDKGILSRTEFKKAYDDSKEKQIGFVGLYLLDAIKITFIQYASMMQGFMGGVDLKALITQVPDSKFPMTFSMGTGKNSMNFELLVPSLSISELIVSVQQVIIQFQMQRQPGGGGGGGGGEPPIF